MGIKDNFPNKITRTSSIFPSDVVVEQYNATSSIHQLLENNDETFVIDNEALSNTSDNILKQQQPKYAELNWVISLAMNGVLHHWICGKLNRDLCQIGVNLLPFSRLHFL